MDSIMIFSSYRMLLEELENTAQVYNYSFLALPIFLFLFGIWKLQVLQVLCEKEL